MGKVFAVNAGATPTSGRTSSSATAAASPAATARAGCRRPCSRRSPTPTPHNYAPADLNGVNDLGQPGQVPRPRPTSCRVSRPTHVPGSPSSPRRATETSGGVERSRTAPSGTSPTRCSTSRSTPNRRQPPVAPVQLCLADVGRHPRLAQLRSGATQPHQLQRGRPTTVRRLNETTLLGMDVDRPGATPYVFEPDHGPLYDINGTRRQNLTQYASAGATTAPPPLREPARVARGVTARRHSGRQRFRPATWRSTPRPNPAGWTSTGC